MTIDEAAEVSGIGRNTMRKLISWGKLPVLLVGRKKIIRSDTLDRFMTANQGRNLLNQSEVRKVYGWVRKARLGYIDLGKGTQTPESAMSLVVELNALRKKTRELEKMNKRLAEENEILADAAAFFAANRRKSGKTKE